MATVGIGQLAKQAEVPIDTIRHYERIGILRPSARLADVERRIAELDRVRESLRRFIATCPGHGRAEDCPILNALSRESGLWMPAKGLGRGNPAAGTAAACRSASHGAI